MTNHRKNPPLGFLDSVVLDGWRQAVTHFYLKERGICARLLIIVPACMPCLWSGQAQTLSICVIDVYEAPVVTWMVVPKTCFLALEMIRHGSQSIRKNQIETVKNLITRSILKTCLLIPKDNAIYETLFTSFLRQQEFIKSPLRLESEV